MTARTQGANGTRDAWTLADDWLVRAADGAIDEAATRARHRDFLAGAWLPGLGPGARPEPVPAERIRVAFAGPGSGSAVLTWGQRDIWATMIRQHSWLPQGGRRPLAPGTRVEDVAAELAYLHSRYPAMRTRLSFEPAAEDDSEGHLLGGVRQRLAPGGETVLEVYDTPPDQNPDSVAARVEAMYRRRPYDLRAEWPIRMAVVRSEGSCSHLVVLMHHLALDAGGAAVMLREVAVRETADPPGMQPLEQAAWQSSEAGRLHNTRTLRYFAEALGALPPGPPSAALSGPRQPRYRSGRLVSPALAAATAEIRARTGVPDAAVLTALIGTAFARLAGSTHVLIRPRVGNRFRPALAGVVCFVAQSGLLVLNLSDTTFDEAVERARRATTAALKHAYFDPDALEALLARAATGYIPMFFNDRRAAISTVDPTSEAAPNPGTAALGDSTFEWLPRGPEPTEPLSVTLEDAPGAVALSMHFDTHVLAPELVEELARNVERAAAEAAADGGARTGIQTSDPGGPRDRRPPGRGGTEPS